MAATMTLSKAAALAPATVLSAPSKSSFLGASRMVAPRAASRVTMAAREGGFSGPLWIPGAIAPEWLDGTLAADRGYDPLGLSRDPTIRNRLVEGEIINGRISMFAIIGALLPELAGIGKFGDVSGFTGGAPIIGLEPIGIPLSPIGIGATLLVFAAESFRLNAEIQKGYKDIDAVYSNVFPGVDFTNFVTGKSDEEVKEWRTKEIKNGRLAMIAIMGYIWQYLYTGLGPVESLTKHLADPHANWLFAASGL